MPETPSLLVKSLSSDHPAPGIMLLSVVSTKTATSCNQILKPAGQSAPPGSIVPVCAMGAYRTKPEIALAEIDRGSRNRRVFGCVPDMA